MTDVALTEKREELKRRLAAGEYRTLIDVVLDATGRIIRKITRGSRPISPWYSIAILYLVVSLITYGLIIILGEVDATRRVIETLSPNGWLGLVGQAAVLLTYVSVVVFNIYVHRIFATFHTSVLDTVESLVTLEDIEHWLTMVCSVRTPLVFSTIVGVLIGLYIRFLFAATTGLFIGYGFHFAFFTAGVIIAAFLYLFFLVVALSARVGRYDLKLYSADPGSSEVISHLSGVLGRFMYGIAIYAAIGTLATAAFGVLAQGGVFYVLLFWIPIVAMFILSQTSLSSIIRRAKWKTLNEIQARVEQLHVADSLGEKDTMDAINRLMDYHDRIKGTRNSAFDLRAVLSLLNSLLLPFPALLLANLDKVLALFQ